MDIKNFTFLHELRYALGPMFGSEDLCVLLYSIVKREKPEIIVELGTGLGVTAAWMAAAMAENGFGKIYTVDNGGHFKEIVEKYHLRGLKGVLEPLANTSEYSGFLQCIAEHAGISKHVKFVQRDIDLADLRWLEDEIEGGLSDKKIDMLFSDFNHSVPTIIDILAKFLPRMSKSSSIFIDSASTKMISYYMLESLMPMIERGKIPIELLNAATNDAERIKIKDIMANSIFRLNHLVERQDRPQNSTTWLKISPPSLLPSGATTVGFR